MHYEIASTTQKGRKKEKHEKNGDFFLTLEDEQYVVLALADGVGSCANDYRASHTLCEQFIEKCSEATAKALPLSEETLIRFCQKIDPILSVDNDMACFCAVVCNKTEDKCTFIHVGDTRIYRYSNKEGLRQVTKDDHGKAVNIKIGGKLYTDHGAVVSAVPIDKAVGDGCCEYNTGTIPFLEGESLVLCSDGMYGSSSFKNDLETLLKKASITESIHGFTTTDDDDATLLIIRREANDEIKASLQDIMLHFDDYKDILPWSLTNKFVNDLLPMLKPDADTDELQAVVDFMKAHSLYPDKKRMEQLFDAAFVIYKSLEEGGQKQRFNEVCYKLKEMLILAHRN